MRLLRTEATALASSLPGSPKELPESARDKPGYSLPELSPKVGRAGSVSSGGHTFSLMPALHLNVVSFCKGTIKEEKFPGNHSVKASSPAYITGVSTGRMVYERF